MSGRVAIKICGLTSVAQVEHAVAEGVDAVGVVLCASPREVTLSEARQLFDAVPDEVLAVAVFRRPTQEQVSGAVAAGARAIQSSGGWRGPLPTGVRWLPALGDGVDLVERAESALLDEGEWPSRWPARLLVDGPRAGSGTAGDWSRAARVASRLPTALAGGLCPQTVAEAIAMVRPAAVDVSSGVESAPGQKDLARITAFVAAVRALEVK